MDERLTRRRALARFGGILGGGLAAPAALAGESTGPKASPAAPGGFGLGLNTATIRGQKVGVVRELELAARAGYAGVELWADGIDEYEKAGGSLDDLRKRAADLGLELPNAIAFIEWMVDDPERRARALEDARRRMEKLARIGCRRIAAPPAGNVKGVDLLRAAERYRDLLAIGDGLGVVPALEIWGSSPVLSRLGQAALVAMEAQHPKACIVADVFHLTKSGSGLDGVRFLAGSTIGIFHLNDVPVTPPLAEQRDSHRVFPGDGTAPLVKLLRDLWDIGYRGMLSLELFNPEQYRRDPAEVLREGIEKMRAVVVAAADSR